MDKAKKIFEKAKKTATDKDEMKATLSKAGNKLKSITANSRELQELKSKLETLVKMFQAHISGEYGAFPTSTIILIVFALIYFITPTDLIPDFIPAIGFSDDATVVMLVAKKVNRDIKKFNEWFDGEFQEAEQE